MKIDYPTQEQTDQLRTLWQEAFGDEDAFLDLFFDHIFSPDRCRCITLEGDVAAALYWLDCRCRDLPLAYIYAVATGEDHRGEGLCRTLMADTHGLLRQLGYAGCLLVPGEASLFEMYAGMGYKNCSAIREFTCDAAENPLRMEQITTEEFAALRRTFLPEGGVIQEGENLEFLSRLTRFYRGDDFLLCCAPEDDHLFGAELLGNADAAGGILKNLGFGSGTFRTPGEGRPFAMYHPLSDIPAPNYFAFAFD